jgi:hypothetical protein
MRLQKIKSGLYSCKYKGFSVLVERTVSGWVSSISINEKEHSIEPVETKKESVALTEEFCDNPSCHLLIDISKEFKNLNYEEVEVFFISPEYTNLVSPFEIKRIQSGSDRYYCTYKESEPKFYLSVTSFTSKCLPNPYLSKWRGDLGNELADFKSELAAHYGTFMHVEIGDFIKNGTYNFDDADERVIDYLLSNDLSMKLIPEWVDKIHNDMLSFAAFCSKHEVQSIACEFPIVSEKWKLGGCIDYPCSMKFGKKRVNAIIDFKSGRKGFYESHELQLKIYREIWNEIFGDILPITHIFNWAPTDWRCGVPKFKLKNQDNGNLICEKYLDLGLAHGFTKEPKPIKRGKGTIKFGQSEIKENVSVISLSDYIKAKNLK